MKIKIALAGNPNSGKTTLFNALTGSNQFVGNWPGVTVEKKEGKLKKYEDVTVVDLPGIYSLSPYTLEEVVARKFLVDEKPDVILNIIDATNLERNLYLTTQLLDLGIPMVLAFNMIDVVRKNGDKIDTDKISKTLGCPIVEISALKGTNIDTVCDEAIFASKTKKITQPHIFSGEVEHALAHIEEAVLHTLPEPQQRWYSIKIFERDKEVKKVLNLDKKTLSHIDQDIKFVEKMCDDDAESIIINERYNYVSKILDGAYVKKNTSSQTLSDKIDRVVTNRWLALPIFVAVIFLVYFVSVTTIGAWVTNFMTDGLFGDGYYIFGKWFDGLPVVMTNLLESINCSPWLIALIVDGIIGGVGAVLSFVPQIFVLFIMLSFLEACGYMSRIAFVLDKIFRKFGLSGKSFIPMLVGTGCGVPGIMASRTIENERDRRLTIMTTTFMPCSAKLPFIALVSGVIFGGAWWVAPSAYFLGVLAIFISCLILQKTKRFAGEPAPFVMELPNYHMPTFKSVMSATWERGWSFIKKAGTIILVSSMIIWFLSYFGFVNGVFCYLDETQLDSSILAFLGSLVSWIFIPLGFGTWQSTVASITGLVAKENLVGSLSVLYGGEAQIAMAFTAISAYSFMTFNLLCAPCIAAIGAISREMNSRSWTWYALIYQTCFAYAVSFVINKFAGLFAGALFANSVVVGIIELIIALALVLGAIFVIFKPKREIIKIGKQ